jgi:hypothetical protein
MAVSDGFETELDVYRERVERPLWPLPLVSEVWLPAEQEAQFGFSTAVVADALLGGAALQWVRGVAITTLSSSSTGARWSNAELTRNRCRPAGDTRTSVASRPSRSRRRPGGSSNGLPGGGQPFADGL